MKAFLRLLMSVLFVTAPLASPSRAQAPVVVSDTQAEQHLGQDVTVEGEAPTLPRAARNRPRSADATAGTESNSTQRGHLRNELFCRCYNY